MLYRSVHCLVSARYPRGVEGAGVWVDLARAVEEDNPHVLASHHLRCRFGFYYGFCLSLAYVTMQSEIVAQLTSRAAIRVLHRSCSVAAEPLHR